eukprot:Skav230127  [mRNA]  locus=scaffold1301:9217:11646:+ [translate_table: standard]
MPCEAPYTADFRGKLGAAEGAGDYSNEDKNRKAAARSEGRSIDSAHRAREGHRVSGARADDVLGDLDIKSPAKVWMRKSEVLPDAPVSKAALNAAAPEFTPSFAAPCGPCGEAGLVPSYGCGSGYSQGYEWTSWEIQGYDVQSVCPPLPEVVPGSREGEYLGIAEMGEWMVFRERKDNAKPFFWNMSTEEKSWDPPAILEALGVAEKLLML